MSKKEVEMISRPVYKSNYDYGRVGEYTLAALKRIRQELGNKNYDRANVNIQLDGIERQIITARRAFANEIFSLNNAHKYARHAKKNRNNAVFTSNKNWPSIMEMTKILKNVYGALKKNKM